MFLIFVVGTLILILQMENESCLEILRNFKAVHLVNRTAMMLAQVC